MKKGLSLIEALVGIALMLVVFVGLLGVFKMAVQIVGVSRARVGAVALANEKMELIRNLPYEEIGTIGGIPPGNVLQNEEISLNSVNYTRRVLIQYVDNPADGEGDDDENGITADYKTARVEVNWEGRNEARPVVLISDFMPKGIETDVGGGTLKINVFDASIVPVVSVSAHIENSETEPPVSIDVFTNSQGKIVFPGAPSASAYEVTITKTDYSSAQTYDETLENPDPQPGHLTILEGETTEASFSIDLLSSKTVKIYEPASTHVWTDSFLDESKIAATSSVVALAGEINLASTTGTGYESSGYLISTTLAPQELDEWLEFSWNDAGSASTTIKYQVLYFDSVAWVALPDTDLAGNESGFDVSPVDISILATSTYPELRLRANFSTIDASTTPSLLDWQIIWRSGRIPLSFVSFDMRGEKIIGYDSGTPPNPIYKYSENLSTGENGSVFISSLECYNYFISIDGTATGYDISESCFFQPVSISPGTHGNITMIVLDSHKNNTLLVSAVDENGDFIVSADIRMYKDGYDKTLQTTNTCGQAFFSPLSVSADYTIEASKAGYENIVLEDIEIIGQTSLEIILSPL